MIVTCDSAHYSLFYSLFLLLFLLQNFHLRNINSFPHDFLTPHKAFIDRLFSAWNEEMRKKLKIKITECAHARARTFCYSHL